MPSIVSQTQVDSPPRNTAACISDHIPAEDLVDTTVTPLVQSIHHDSVVAVEKMADEPPPSSPWAFLSWKTSGKKPKAKPVQVASYVRNAKGSSGGKASFSRTSASMKKRCKIVDTPSESAAVSDPASIVLAKQLHHQYLMELHESLKKNRMVASVASVHDPSSLMSVHPVLSDAASIAHFDDPSPLLFDTVVSNANEEKRTHGLARMHGLAPAGMPIPEKGMAYIVRADNVAKEPVKESNQEMYNRFKHEEVEDQKKKDQKAVKKLKKDGKVRTLAPFMYS
jgi:hypothetical protein